MAYELEFPAELVAVHPVFRVSLLKKCMSDPIFVLTLESVSVKDNLSYKDYQLRFLTVRLEG